MVQIDGSSNVSQVGYSPKREVLRVKFQNGGLYDYAKVSPEKFKGILQADSKGGYVHEHVINGGHDCKKLNAGE